MSQEQEQIPTGILPNTNDNARQFERQDSPDGLVLVPTILKIKQIIFLKHSQFLRLLQEFNETLESFTRDEPFYLKFTIVPRTDSTMIWKALIRIRCSKVCECKFSMKIIVFLPDFTSRSKRFQ